MALFRATIYYIEGFVDENDRIELDEDNVILLELDSPEMVRAVNTILYDRVLTRFNTKNVTEYGTLAFSED
jgi:hypothetical protein